VRLRRLLAGLAVVAVLLPAGAGASLPPGGTFLDDDGNTHEGFIEAIAYEKITSGCNPPLNNMYCPADSVTRAQMATFIAKALGLEPSDDDGLFTDHLASVHRMNINAVRIAGITSGCNPPDNTMYCPTETVSRAQMATFIAKALGLQPRDDNGSFTDHLDSVHRRNINAIRIAGVTQGCNPPANDMYCPGDDVSRAQMATFLGRALGLTPDVPPPRPDDMTGFPYVDYQGIRPEEKRHLFVAAMAHADFNDDGYFDVFMSPGEFLTEDQTPMEMYLADGAGGYYLDDDIFTGGVPGAVHPRKAIVDYFTLDGRPDVLVADHGFDAEPFPGAPPVLLLSDGMGELAATYFPDLTGFHHGAASGDVDEDGDPDIVLSGTIPDHDYKRGVLLNDGSGSFTFDETRMPDSVHWPPFFTVEIIDVDDDGHLDILISGHEYESAATSIFWGDGTGYFTDDEVTVIPAVAGHEIAIDLDAADLDGDGMKDIAVTRTGSPPDWYIGYYLQILRQTSPRVFADETVARIPEGHSDAEDWIVWVRLIDTNWDGFIDILVDDAAVNLRWLNDGFGDFTKTTTS